MAVVCEPGQDCGSIEKERKIKVEMVVEQYLTVQELAEMLRKHPQTIRKDIREGNLKARRLGGRNSLRIPMSEATSYIAWLEGEAEQN